MIRKQAPYTLHTSVNRYARTIWYSTSGYKPSIVVKADIATSKAQELAHSRGVSVNAIFVKALAMALTEFPRLNYYCFFGKPIWGGDNTKISLVYEVGDEGTINIKSIIDAEKKEPEIVHEEIKSLLNSDNLRAVARRTLGTRMMNAFPRLAYHIMKFTGALQRDYIRGISPVIFSNVNVSGITSLESCGIGFNSMIASPGRIRDEKCEFNIAFNHEVTNARPVAKYLARVKEIIEGYQ